MRTEQRVALLQRVADLVPPAARPLLVGIDGPDGVGKSWFADELVECLTGSDRVVVRASVDDFHHPRAHRHALGLTAESVWSRSYDYRALRRELVDPWSQGSGRRFRRRWHDVGTDEYVDSQLEVVPEHGVLVVDGVFLQRPELSTVWDVIVWLDVPAEVSVARLAARDGRPNDPMHPDHQRYLEAQRRYREWCDPASNADLVVDSRDLGAPTIRESGGPPGWQREGEEWVRLVRVRDGAIARHVDDVTGDP